MIDIAKNALFTGEYQLCLDICKEQIFKVPNPSKELNELVRLSAVAALKLKDSNAVYFCNLANQVDGHGTYELLNLARAYLINDEPAKAEQILIEISNSKESLKKEALKELINVYQATGHYHKCRKIYEVLLNDDPGNLKLWMNACEMYNDDNTQEGQRNSLDIMLRAREYLKKLIPRQKEKKEEDDFIKWKRNIKLDDRLETQDTITKIINTKLDKRIAQIYMNVWEYEKSYEMLENIKEYNLADPVFWRLYAWVCDLNGKTEEAKKAHLTALKLDDSASYKFSTSFFFMRHGDFAAGLPLYEARLNYGKIEAFSWVEYNKALKDFHENPDFLRGKKLCIYCEQGFGDTMMYSGLITSLCAVAGHVTFVPQEKLGALFANYIAQHPQPNLTLCPEGIPTKEKFEYTFPIGSLPLFLNYTTIEEITANEPMILRLEKPNNKRKRVGFYWNSSNAEEEIYCRNLEKEFFLEALKGIECDLVCIQDRAQNLPKNIEMPELTDFLSTYEVMRELDLVVGIDSSPGHLASCAGVEHIVVLPQIFDYRFGPFNNPRPIYYPGRKNIHILRQEKTQKESIKKLRAMIKKVLGVKSAR